MEIKDLIMEDNDRGIFRYHRSTLTSPGLLELERDRIFGKCWIYLGHEADVEKPGDFRRRTVVDRPLFFVRGKDHQVRVFLNTCPHRGATICRLDEGNADVLQFLPRLVFQHELRLGGEARRGRLQRRVRPGGHGAETATPRGQLPRFLIR